MKLNYLYLALLAFLLVGCSDSDDENQSSRQPQKSIVILYENDVHCNIEGYTKLAGLRDAIAASDTAYVGVVSNGDYLSGGLAGAVSQGEYIIDIMRNVGYDAITLGNHEFDFGIPWLEGLMKKFNAPVVCANFFHYGATTPVYAPYVIKKYGPKRVAFVGVVTPESMELEGYSFYDKEGNQLYDLHTDQVYSMVQQAADKARREGADYVVVLSHLGESFEATDISAYGLVAATNGIDVVLDGHSHSIIEHEYIKNKDGKSIIVTQSGTKFENVGKLVINKEGICSTVLIPTEDISYVNASVSATVDSVNVLLNNLKLRKLATTAYDLQINDEDGNRIVRSAETNLGDLIADAFRIQLNADIGLENAGGIRSFIKAGDISYGDVFDVLAFSNEMCKIEATGEQILTMLKKCTDKTPEEDGNFPQVSGMRFTIHTVSHSVSDVVVYDAASSEYKPIDLQKTYTIALSDYYETGGFYNTLKGCKLLENKGELDRDVVAAYLQLTLRGNTGSAYAHPQGRITLVED